MWGGGGAGVIYDDLDYVCIQLYYIRHTIFFSSDYK